MSNNSIHTQFLQQAITLAQDNAKQGGRPFGAVLVKEGKILATGVNEIIHSHDPSTHAEMEAIRHATREQKNPSLKGCVIYASGHPCPMCLAAIVLSGIEAVYYAFDNHDAEPFGFSSQAIYKQLGIRLTPQPLPLIKLDTGITAAQLYVIKH